MYSYLFSEIDPEACSLVCKCVFNFSRLKCNSRSSAWSKLRDISSYHFSECNARIGERPFPANPTLEVLTYLLDRNCLLTGDPGWGKTTSAKIITAVLSGIPYDLLDSTEIRGHPHFY